MKQYAETRIWGVIANQETLEGVNQLASCLFVFRVQGFSVLPSVGRFS